MSAVFGERPLLLLRGHGRGEDLQTVARLQADALILIKSCSTRHNTLETIKFQYCSKRRRRRSKVGRRKKEERRKKKKMNKRISHYTICLVSPFDKRPEQNLVKEGSEKRGLYMSDFFISTEIS